VRFKKSPGNHRQWTTIPRLALPADADLAVEQGFLAAIEALRTAQNGSMPRWLAKREPISPSRLGFILSIISGVTMIRRFIGVAAIVAATALPHLALAQGVPGGIERGAREGERAAGPVGAVVGGTIGGVVGGVAGVLGVEQRPRFRSYVVEQRRPSYQYREEVRVGAVLPEQGVTYYDVPPEYGVRDYRYTVVNGRTVLVEPRTHRIVEIVE
jgi:hypothetical protein